MKPQRKSFFVLENPYHSGSWCAKLTATNEELHHLAMNFEGVLYSHEVPWAVYLEFDPNYDYEEVWLLLYDALQEANDRLMTDERLSATYQLDDLDTTGL